MDELTIDGKIYLSSKRAAAITGYAKDYVGQLCREGRVEARLVGRSWYVYEPSIMKHRFDQEEQIVPADDPEIGEESPENLSEKTNEQAIFEDTRYEPEEVKTIDLKNYEHSEVGEQVAEIENSWKQWFAQDSVGIQRDQEDSQEDIQKSNEVIPIHKIDSAKTSYHQPSLRQSQEDEITLKKQDYRAKAGTKTTKKRSKDNHLVLKATLVGLMLISMSIALLGSGVGSSIVGTTSRSDGPVEFFAGINPVEINK